MELKVSEDLSKISHLVDYLKAKIRTECTLLVLDGLSKITQHWVELAQYLSELPIKILLTTREEDWQKYGTEIYKLSFSMPKIKLSFQEAQDIHNQFSKRSIIHINPDGTKNPFQYYWEQVEKKGLLIEYIYLITQGQMLESRLREQINAIEKEENGGVTKLETLRLVALADVCNIKIETLHLNQFLKSENLLQNIDRNTLFSHLEKEYSIRFDEDFIEGLHPIRSLHLLNILNERTPIIESVANLCQIIESQDYFSLFAFFPTLISDKNKNKYFDYLIPYIHDKPYKSLSNSIDGLFAYETGNYWNKNKESFDNVYHNLGNAGGYIYSMALLPYPNIETLHNLTKYNEGLIPILAKAEQTPKFDLANSFINQFVAKLHSHFFNNSFPTHTIKGLSGLLRWFDIFNLPIVNLLELSDNELLALFYEHEITDVASLLELYKVAKPDKYKAFSESFESEIISLLKEKTNTPTLHIKENELFAEYIFQPSNSEEVNDSTNDRMNLFMKVLPFYERYNVEAAFLHYPSEAITRVIKSDSRKSFTHESLIKEGYQVRLNGIWHNEIDSKYHTNSEYEWQKNTIHLRELCLSCIKMKVRLLEALLDNIPERYKKIIIEIENITDTISQLSRSSKKRPNIKHLQDNKNNTAKSNTDESHISDWEFSFITCFIAQFNNIVISEPDLDKKRLAKVNLESAINRLPKMQIAFDKIAAKIFAYFDNKDLIKEETEWYARLKRTVLFYEEVLGEKYKRCLCIFR